MIADLQNECPLRCERRASDPDLCVIHSKTDPFTTDAIRSFFENSTHHQDDTDWKNQTSINRQSRIDPLLWLKLSLIHKKAGYTDHLGILMRKNGL